MIVWQDKKRQKEGGGVAPAPLHSAPSSESPCKKTKSEYDLAMSLIDPHLSKTLGVFRPNRLKRPLLKDITEKEPSVNERKNKSVTQTQKPWLDIAVNFLYSILKNTTFFIIKMKKTGKKYRIPRAKRGNIGHAHREQNRLQQIQWVIDNLIKTREIDPYHIETNTLFVTLTCQYDPSSLLSIENSWHNVKNELPKFIKKFKNKASVALFGNLVGYVVCFEAHELGGCHAHIAMIFDKPILCTRMNSGTEQKDVWRVPGENRDLINKYWTWNTDIRGSDTSAIAGYLTKELGKANHVEGAVRRWMSRRDTGKLPVTDEEIAQYKNDVKKIWAYYFAIKLNMRLLHVSKSIPRLDKIHHKSQDDEEAQEEVKTEGKDEVEEIIIVSPVISSSQATLLPYGGEVKPEDRDVFLIDDWFEGIRCPPRLIRFKGTIGEWQKKMNENRIKKKKVKNGRLF